MGNPLKISEVGGKQKGILDKGNRRNFRIHGTHTDTLVTQALKDVGR